MRCLFIPVVVCCVVRLNNVSKTRFYVFFLRLIYFKITTFEYVGNNVTSY